MRHTPILPLGSAPSPWRVMPFSRLPAGEQMALGEAMLAAVEAPALRWRQIVPAALVLGHGQPLTAVDAAACRAAGLEVYRRATGGTAVLSGPDLLGLDLVLPAGDPLLLPDVTRSYAWLAEALAAGLRDLGIEAAPIPPEAARAQTAAVPAGDPRRLACYATLSPHEIVAGGRKLVGLAQARRRAGALYQAGLLLRWRPQQLVPLLAVPAAEREQTIANLRACAMGLAELRDEIDVPSIIEALSAALARATGRGLVPSSWSQAELSAAAAARTRFQPLTATPAACGHKH